MLRRRAWIINFEGLGNQVILYPIMRAIEMAHSEFEYFTSGGLISELQEFFPQLRLTRHRGITPSIWRRFEHENWSYIFQFLHDHQIDTVVNLRNVDIALDPRYSLFKKACPYGIVFYDLTEVVQNQPQIKSNSARLRYLFSGMGYNSSSVESAWLRHAAATPRGAGASILAGLFTGASQAVKRWPQKRWIKLARNLVLLPRIELRLFSGQSTDERAIGRQIANATRSWARDARALREITTPCLVDLTFELSQLDLLITNDSLPLHLGMAVGLPVVGLYLATDALIWGGESEDFIAVQSQVGLNCPAMKTEMGSCIHYYGGCPGPCADEVTVERVWRAFEILLMRQIDRRRAAG